MSDSHQDGFRQLPFWINAGCLLLIVTAAKQAGGYNPPILMMLGTAVLCSLNLLTAMVLTGGEHGSLPKSLVITALMVLLIGSGLCFTL